MRPTLCFCLLASLLLTAQTAFPLTSDSVRCDGGLVCVGDVATDVLKKCGDPSYTTQRQKTIVEYGTVPGEYVTTTIMVDDWLFNFGPDRFQYRLLLRNGKVLTIESLDYGY